MRVTMLILVGLLPCFAFCATRIVKQDGSGDYTHIQAALDVASPGDTVLVHPGRYFENLTIQSTDISLMSLEGTTADSTYIASTIIDGNNINPCIIISRYASNNSIRGFSITKGMRSGGNGGGLSIGLGSTTSLTNCRIFQNQARTGGGIGISGASLTLHGTSLYANNAFQLGGGVYTSTGGSTYNLTFDPINRCSIYNNRAGAGQDIYIQHATSDLYVPLDTFSVAEPSSYYAIFLSSNLPANQIQFDIWDAYTQEIDSDLYVSTIGDDTNDGLTPSTALKTIHEAIYRIAPDSLNQNTVHILPGEYSRTDNDQIFPIALKSWVIVQGSGIDTTTVICEPHPDIPLGYGYADVAFSNFTESVIRMQDLTITSRYSSDSSAILLYRLASLSLTNVRIYNIMPNTISAIHAAMHNAHESVWDNVTIENINSPGEGLVTLLTSDTPDWEMTAMSGRIINSTFRNAVSTYTSSSVWANPLVNIKCDGEVSFENCQFSDLTMLDDDSFAIAIGCVQYPQQQNHFSFRNCLFSNNESQGGVALIASSNNPRIDITNCTFAGNQSDAYTLMVNGDVNIVNSIFYNDTPYQIKVSPMDGNPNEYTHLSIDYSLVKDGINGIMPYPVQGNTINFLPTSISSNPFFLGGDDIHDPMYYSLSAGSPCINSGTPDTTGLDLLPYDLAGNWRIWDGRIDMGCYEFGSAPWVANDDPVVPVPEQLTLYQNYPNPFNPSTTLSYQLNESGRVNLDIYNLRGQLVKSLVAESREAGYHSITWNGTDSKNRGVASGVYLYRLKCGNNVQTKRMLLMK